LTDFSTSDNLAARLAAIVASSDDLIVSKTLDGIITSWNPAAERILGYAEDEAIGKHITLIIPPERWSEEDEVLARIRRGERVEHFETVRRAKSGTLLNISLTVSPIKDPEGRGGRLESRARYYGSVARPEGERTAAEIG
jgi:PAS domain S-box-containing protein